MSTLWIERNRKPAAATLAEAGPAPRQGQNWHTTTFRWLTAYAVIFSLGFMVLLGLIQYSVTGAMEREADSGLRWQLRYFDSRDDADLPRAIASRATHGGGLFHSHYGLFAANGRHLAGDLDEAPRLRRYDHVDQAHESATGQTMTQRVGTVRRELRAMGEIRPDGNVLIVARTLDDVRRVHAELVKALVAGGIVCLSASVLGGLLIGLRQVRRVAAMRKATAAIAAGDLSLRLPVKGFDEIDMLAQLVNRMLDEVERLMTEVKFAADGIAHDLRTPLTRLRFSLANAKAEADRLKAGEVASLLWGARDEVDALIARFTAMLRIAQLGTRQRRAAFTYVDLAPLIHDLCELYRPLAEDKRVQIHTSIAPVETVWADRELLFEAFSNLLDNAVKFSPDDGHVHVCLELEEAGARLRIFDNGPGIPEAERNLVLNHFYRSRHTAHVSGSGLGLGIVSAIVRLHDFRLSLGGSEQGAIVCVECWPHEPDAG
ncbi:HAMP domain-containing sensor histidine kinase [Paraburkholderia acidisoli]|uniref:histidine kinase n=1 Tax=Paraburkholderia acidisoli TaxID=2571748 RepID=A0A7Z2JHE1_9BURK|nr:HAMP domain-containing sensor histidine kinase [Paraburkholderia acidisoli]QGZ64656.1 HAMP domain-containing protein [Paraburkholderia acidisoli]